MILRFWKMFDPYSKELGEDLQVTYITRVAFVPMIGEALEAGGG